MNSKLCDWDRHRDSHKSSQQVGGRDYTIGAIQRGAGKAGNFEAGTTLLEPYGWPQGLVIWRRDYTIGATDTVEIAGNFEATTSPLEP